MANILRFPSANGVSDTERGLQDPFQMNKPITIAKDDSIIKSQDTLMIASSQADINLLKPYPDLIKIRSEVHPTLDKFVSFLLNTKHKKIVVANHGAATGIKFGDEFVEFDKIRKRIMTQKVLSNIHEIEFFSCQAGRSPLALFQIAKILNVKQIKATTNLRARNIITFNFVNDTVLKNINLFKDYIVFEDSEIPITQYLKKYNNKLFVEYFFPLGFDDFRFTVKNLNFETKSEEFLDQLFSLSSSRQFSKSQGTQTLITDINDASEKEDFYMRQPFPRFEVVTIAP